MLFLFISLFKKVKTAFTNFTLLNNQCKSNLEYCYFYKYIVLCKKKNLRMKAGQSKYTPNTEKAYDTYYDT